MFLILPLLGLIVFILAVHMYFIAESSNSDGTEGGDLFLKMSALPSYPGFKYGLFRRDMAVSYGEFLGLLLRSDPTVSQLLSEALVSHYEAVFFECVPVSARSLDTTGFEFVVLRAPRLEGISVDIGPFQHHFRTHGMKTDNQVIAFPNLGNDALLVVPCPPKGAATTRHSDADINQLQHFAHLAAFLRQASAAHKSNLWRVAAEQLLVSLAPQDPHTAAQESTQQLWLSTSGLGISWLHVRIDRVPKYYNYREFKNMAR